MNNKIRRNLKIKMMKKITTLMITLVVGIASWAQCDATFMSYDAGNGQMYFLTLDYLRNHNFGILVRTFI